MVHLRYRSFIYDRYEAMSKATKTKISIDESESAGTFEYEEGYHSSSDESESRIVAPLRFLPVILSR